MSANDETQNIAWGPDSLPKREIMPQPLPREEYNLEKYARQTRNATVTIAVIISIAFISSLIIGLLAVVAVVKINDSVNNQTSNLNSSQSACESEGGSLPC